MSNSKFTLIAILLIIFLPFTYGGCYVAFSSGDTGRDRSEDDDPSSGAFIGITSKAAINSENAVQLTAGALAGGLMPHDSPGSMLDQAPVNLRKDSLSILQLPLVLADSLQKIEPSPALIFFSRSDFITENGRVEGGCGGSFSYTLQLNRETKTFDAGLAFESFCAQDITISGKTDIDGSLQTGSGKFVTATFNLESLSDGARSMEGEISMDFSDTPILVTFNAYSIDEHNAQVCWIRDYSLNLFEFAGYVEMEVFGTFYHPDHGYVTLTTSDPFIIHSDDNRPASGRLIIYGDHNTSAQLQALDHLSYGIEADSAGDGILDWDSGTLNWNAAASG